VSYDVEKTRVGQDASYDKLTLEVWTNGSINPQEAISVASKILVEHFSILVNLNEAGQLASFIVEREDEEKNKV
ncbi:DNA-directed RNA polymerase subunit alpha, partial [Acinetobacter baumannii]